MCPGFEKRTGCLILRWLSLQVLSSCPLRFFSWNFHFPSHKKVNIKIYVEVILKYTNEPAIDRWFGSVLAKTAMVILEPMIKTGWVLFLESLTRLVTSTYAMPYVTKYKESKSHNLQSSCQQVSICLLPISINLFVDQITFLAIYVTALVVQFIYSWTAPRMSSSMFCK